MEQTSPIVAHSITIISFKNEVPEQLPYIFSFLYATHTHLGIAYMKPDRAFGKGTDFTNSIIAESKLNLHTHVTI